LSRPRAYAPSGAAIATMAYLGLRPSECLALAPDDLDAVRGVLTVRRALDLKGGMKTTKTAKSRAIPLPDVLKPVLRKHVWWLSEASLRRG
jgi:integrase